ncbi:hypothetical protein [Pyruvatibacter sp.]|uniref:hypothetical protein n=1 Tax=Pyruvatibacter sp. TaxID=1981328 RepID=UPI0032EB2899
MKTKSEEGEIRRVVREDIPDDPRFNGSYVPREAAHEVDTPLVVWVGAADKSSGEWFTFGDLVSLYGDFRRIITCDAKATNNDCRLTDTPSPLPVTYDEATFQKARYAAMKDLAQGWNFWDDHLITSQASTVLLTNRGVIEGKNTQGAWSDEFYKIAKGNHWHFGPTALRWYVAMHRQAFYLMAQAATQTDPNKRDILIWKAMHYEGHALHSLTDLFAPGHVLVDRYETTNVMLTGNDQRNAPFPKWQAEIWGTTFSGGGPRDGQLRRSPVFRAVPKADDNDLDVLTGPQSNTIRNARYESNFHNNFNAAGAEARNLKSRAAQFGLTTQRPHSDLPHIWRALGDGDLYEYQGNKRLNPGQGEWTSVAVEDSILSLFDGYQAVLEGSDAAKLSMSPALFEALADIPIELRNACVDNEAHPERCFAPDNSDGTPAAFRWVSYAPLILELLGLPPSTLDDERLLPNCTGRSAIDGPSSSLLKEGCEQAWDDGTPPQTVRLKAASEL